MLSVERALTAKFPALDHGPRLLTSPLIKFLRLLFHEREINHFLEEHQGMGAFEFVEKVLERFNFGYAIPNLDLERIPAEGRVVIVANHPLGALDALALIQMVSRVRRDVKVLANDLLMHLPPMRPLLLPVDNLAGRTRREGVQRILESLDREEAVIVFPAGEVSRAHPTGIKDGKWKPGFLKFAQKRRAPILPVHIDARNSALFYGLSMLYKPLSTALLVHEMFKQHSKMVRFRVGEPIPHHAFSLPGLTDRGRIKLLRDHFYRVAKGKRGLLKTETPVAHPEERQLLKRELKRAELLGETSDRKKIYLCDAGADSALMREIGRLREVTFRAVGEGSGRKRDLDRYDPHYRHLVLWDDEELEVVGAYRLGESNALIERFGEEGFYTRSLFRFSDGFRPYLRDSIELGRSFVQPRYWGSRALEYLWQGIGVYLRSRPHIRYMFGPVSISNSYSQQAQELLVHFYRSHFGGEEGVVTSNHPFRLGRRELEECGQVIGGAEYAADFRALKKHLAQMGATVPTLYKQYSELCEEGGVRFLEFGIDPDFENCLDGFILVEVAKIKESKRRRYMYPDGVPPAAAA
ncbi:bifunctional ornithine lipid synthase OlsF [Endothiovibrio diazotrophicus]